MGGRPIQSDMSMVERLLLGGCEETRDRLSDIVDGEARGIRGWRARAHLARCELCRAAYESLLRTVERLRALGENGPPLAGSVADTVVERARHEQPPS